MRINNNITAINAHRNYTVNNSSIGKNVEKLSSGYRINRAGDDAAGLAISEKMRAQIRGLTMASKNSQDAISLVQTAEGALQSMHNILQRMRELAVQSASDTNETTVDRNALNLEFKQLIQEIDDTAAKTRFNDQGLIDGTFSKNMMSTAVTNTVFSLAWAGSDAVRPGQFKAVYDISVTEKVISASTAGSFGNVATISSNALKLNAMGLNESVEFKIDASATTSADSKLNGIWQVGYNAVTKTFTATNQITGETRTSAAAASAGKATITIDFGDGMVLTSSTPVTVNNVDLYTGFSGAFQVQNAVTKQDEVTKEFISVNGEEIALEEGMNKAVFQNNNVSVDFASSYTKGSLGTNGSTGSVGQIFVNRSENKNLTIQTGANQGDELAISLDQMDAWSLGVKTANISNRLDASAAITQVNNALNLVSTQRATLGALQNRLEFKISNLDIGAENLQAAESRIRDVDMAKEMTSFTKNNILFQASTAMLAQANALPQGVLQLLG